MEMRAFARAKEAVEEYEKTYDHKTDPEREHAPKGKAVELVDEIKGLILQKALDGSLDR